MNIFLKQHIWLIEGYTLMFYEDRLFTLDILPDICFEKDTRSIYMSILRILYLSQ